MATKSYRLPTKQQHGKVDLDSNLDDQNKLHTIISHDSFTKHPFQIPKENFWLELWRVEKEKIRRQRVEERTKPIHEKTTFSSRQVSRVYELRNKFEEEEQKENKANNVGEYSKRVLSETLKVRPVEREFTFEYIQRKRDMFLLEYSLQNKRLEIARYKQKSKDEEQGMKIAAQRLYEDAILFDDFLKATDDAAVEAMQLAEKEQRIKMERVAEFKKLQVMLSALNTKISNMDEQLAEYYRYKNFLVLVYENYVNKQQQPLLYDEWQQQREGKVMEILQKRCLQKLEQKTKKTQGSDRRKSVLGFNSRRSTRQSNNSSTPNIVQAYVDSLPLSQQLYPEEWEEEYLNELNAAKMGNQGKGRKPIPKIEVVSPVGEGK